MPRILRTVKGFATAGGAGTNPATLSPGTSGTFAVDAFSSGNAYLESVWARGATTDWVRYRSPRMHDNNQGLRLFLGTLLPSNLLAWGSDIQLFSSDVPTVEIDATAASSAVIALTHGYDDLGSTGANLANWSEVQSRIKYVSGVEVDTTAGAIGNYGAAVAINSSFDNFKADYSYALLGYTVSAATACIAINGADTGNFDIGMPGDPDPRETRDYFIKMSQQSGRPCIPIIQANNRAGTTIKSVDSTGATAVKMSLIFALLGG